MQKINKTGFILSIVLALIIWFSVILQFIISTKAYMNTGRTFGGSIVQIFSFFTVLSNMLAGFCLVAIVFKPTSKFHSFFAGSSTLPTVAIYITIVGLIYNTVLRGIVLLDGLFFVTNELTHVFNPIAYVIFWLFIAPKEKLSISQGLKWLWFPLLYLVYALIRGALFHFYPYPFIDADKLGYQKVLINSFFVMSAFLIFGILFFYLNNWLSVKKNKVP